MRPGSSRLALALLAALCVPAAADDPRPEERGYPILSAYAPGDYDGGTQSWDLAQDRDGLVYVANLWGLLIHDGEWWQSVSLSNGRAVFCVATDAEGRVATGGVSEFGYLKPDESGTLVYESLLARLPADQREVGDVWGVHATPHGFVYLADTAIFLWNGGEVTTLATLPEGASRLRGHPAGGALYVAIPGKGLHRIHDDGVTLVPGGDAFAERPVDLVLPGDHDGSLLLAIRGEGLRRWDDGSETAWAPEVSARLRDTPAGAGVRLPDGRYAIGTRGGGLLLMRANGGLDRVVDADAGLPDDMVYATMLDRDGSLWVAMDDGLARIEAGAPLSVFDERAGLEGGIEDIARHAGRLWVGTRVGLFVLERGSGRARMTRVPDIPADLARPVDVGDALLVGTRNGIYAGGEAGFRRVPDSQGIHVYTLSPSPVTPGRVWVGMRNGITSLRRAPGGWSLEAPVADSPRYVQTFVERANGTLWAGSIVDGVVRVDVASRRVVSTSGEAEVGVFAIGERILTADVANVQILDEDTGRPRDDASLAPLNGHGEPFRLAATPDGSLWLNTVPPHVAASDGAGSYQPARPLSAVAVDDIQNLDVDAEGVVWIMTNRGLFRFTGGYEDLRQETPPPAVRRVVHGGSQIAFGGAAAQAEAIPVLPFGHGRLRFEFASASYRPGVEYQYRLEPTEDAWSGWTEASFTEYTQLTEGRYAFHVRSRPRGSEPSRTTSWRFRVTPPWYRTPLAWLGWIALAALGVGGLVRVRTAGLRRRARELESQVDVRTTELREAIEGLKLARDEVRDKNRELEAANARLELLSRHDDLTGLWNRRHLDQTLPEEWNRGRRHRQALAFLIMDLDHFKDLNDRHGHAAGDECLRRVGAFLEHSVGRSGEVVARYGGEEFAMLLPGLDTAAAAELAERLREGIVALDIPHEAAPAGHVTASFGVASVLPAQAERPQELLERADRALYRAKADGRNCVRVAEG